MKSVGNEKYTEAETCLRPKTRQQFEEEDAMEESRAKAKEKEEKFKKFGLGLRKSDPEGGLAKASQKKELDAS